jgi:NADH:ubiquinone oxidoreductase subunit F (NADH-binding)
MTSMGHLLPEQPINTVDEYVAAGPGGAGIERAMQIGRAATIEELKRSGLRGRGGAGFPTGRKWAGVRDQPGTHRYVVANGAEGEPGTFKDRTLLRTNPYQLVEGVVIAAYALDATEVYIGVKAKFEREATRLIEAIAEMQRAGIGPECTMTVVRGPDEYLFGEEKALLEVIEGGEPLPRLFPPYEHGLFATAPQSGWEPKSGEPGHPEPHESNPTLVNNVETLANIAHILSNGADWFRSTGTTESPGTSLCTVVGDVRHAGVAEMAMGTPLRDVLDDIGGGTGEGRQIQAVFSGVANAVITPDQLDVPLSYEGFASIGSGIGSGGFIVVDDSACMIDVAYEMSRFLAVESCGQCPPCKTGASEITDRLLRLRDGRATSQEVTEIAGWLDRVTDSNRCYLAVEEQVVVRSILRAFSEEVMVHLEGNGCGRPPRFMIPLLDDIVDGRAVLDERHRRKQLDWTYADD